MVLSLNRFEGKVAIVTGASAGIGAAIVQQLVEAGLIVVGLARRIDQLEELSKKLSPKRGKFYPFKADITKEDQIKAAFEYASKNCGPVHVLVNNAGLAQPTNLSEGNTEMWLTTINTNIVGLCISTREAVTIMKANNIQGHIVHINSVAGHKVVDIPNRNVYAATKHAVTALTETLRQELNRDNVKIKVTSVSPGAVETEFIRVAVGGDEELGRIAVEERKARKMPFLKSEDVADAVTYALSTPPHVQVHELIIKPVGEPF